MKSNIIKQVAVFAIIIPLLVATQTYAADTPKEVVAKFCKLDFEGNRIGDYSKIEPLISYPAEPGWDVVLGISKYEIFNEKIDGDSAEVTVKYQIDRAWFEDFDEKKEHEIETFKLKQVDGVWRISEYIVYPRVSSKVLCSQRKLCK